MASVSVKNHPNFAVICSFLQRYGEQLRLPDLTIPELEQVIEATNSVGHGLKELIITLMRRIVSSIKPDRWEKHLIRLIDNYHSSAEAWELESLGFSLCKLETKLSILKYLCETQFDDNPRFKRIVNNEDPLEQKLKPIGKDRLGMVYWYQQDHECNIRVYREEQDDTEETTWQSIVHGRDDLADLIAELKQAQDLKQPLLDSLESSRSATPVLTNGEIKVGKPEPIKNETVVPNKETTVVNGLDGDRIKAEGSGLVQTEETDVKSEAGRLTKTGDAEIKPEVVGDDSLAIKGKTIPADTDSTKVATTVLDSGVKAEDEIVDFRSKCKKSERVGDETENGCERTEGIGNESRIKSNDSGQKIDQENTPCKDIKRKEKTTADAKEVAGDGDKKEARTKVGNAIGAENDKDVVTETCSSANSDKVTRSEVTNDSHEAASDGQQDLSRKGEGRLSEGKEVGGEDGRKSPPQEKEGDGIEETDSKEKGQRQGRKDTECAAVDETVEKGAKKEDESKEQNEVINVNKGKDENLEETVKMNSQEETGKDKSADVIDPTDVAKDEKSGKAARKDISGEDVDMAISEKNAGEKESPEVRNNSGKADVDAEQSLEGKDVSEKVSSKPTPADESESTLQEKKPDEEPAWTRRRLRARKPPPKKEEEEEPKPKKQRTKKVATVVISKKKGGRKKGKETESESSEEEEISLAQIKDQLEEQEEEEEESEEEEENSSDEEFTLGQTKEPSIPAEEVEPPVRKARTAKSKSTSKDLAESEATGDPCIKCGNYDHPELILLCDSCDAGYHTACLRPPLMYVPDGEWFCPTCEHLTLVKNLQATLEIVDGRLKIIRQKNRKKTDKFRWLLTEVCPANILPEESSVLITRTVKKVEKPARPRHERTRPKPKKVFVEEPDEIEYIQRRSGRNRKQISYKFEDFDSAINTAIHDEVEEKRKAKASGENIVYGQSRGKDISTIEAAEWEEEEKERRRARKRRKKLTDLEATTEEEEEDDESEEYRVKSDSNDDDDFIADDNETTTEEEEEEEEEPQYMSGTASSGSEYGRKPGTKKRRRRVPIKKRDLGPVRRSDRNIGKQTKVYEDSSSTEEEEERARDAWRTNPIITARRQRKDSEASTQSENDQGSRKGRSKDFSESEEEHSSASEEKKKSQKRDEKRRKPDRKRRKRDSSSEERRSSQQKKRNQKKESSSSEEDEEEFVQQKRKFRIDSEDSANEKDKSGSQKGSEKGGSDDSEGERLRAKKQRMGRSTRRRQSRVDYRKMAEGSSSEGEESEGVKEEGGNKKGIKGESENKKGAKDDSEAMDDGGADVSPESQGDKGKEPEGSSEEGATDHLENNKSRPKDRSKEEDSILSPISDLEDIKDVVPPAKPHPTEQPTDKKTDDSDELEGVTDIFDYLTKE